MRAPRRSTKSIPKSKPPCWPARDRSSFICARRRRPRKKRKLAVDRLAGELEDELGDAVFSSQGESLEQIVGYYLQMRNAKLAVAESCTGGMVAERITSVAGSSRYFLGGAVVYSNDLKTLFADMPPLMIEAHGAVSKEVALALAENIREICNADIGVGVTGIAGPGGGTEEKPVGLVYVAVTDGQQAGSRATALSRRPRAHSALGQPAGARHGAPHADVSLCDCL